MGMILGIGRIREKVDSLLRLAFGLLTVLAMLLPAAAKAQTSYPVQVNVMVTPPNSVYLTDYYARGSEKLKVQLLLKEVDRPSFPVKLRFKIEGSALRLTSRPGVNLPPFTLQGGVMVEAAGDLLAPYLSLNALVAEGADASSFQGKGLRMADGFYKVEVWAEEMGRSVRVSNIATTFISTMLYQSPVITSPIDKAILPDQGIQNIIFQWMPRHLGASLDVTQSTYYKVRLVEVWPRERDPQEAIRSSKPLYEGLSNSTTFVYGAGQPTLISGRRYALQVQAQDADQRDLFVGQGYSNVVCFTYGEECQAPQGLKVEVNGPNNANALWTSNPRNTGYTFAYRKVYGLDTAWVEQPMGIASYSLSGLTPVTSYQARVSATCGLSKSIWSQPRAFTTADRPEIKFECGKNPNIPTITDRTLYPNLKDGDRISAADFKVEILTVSLGSRGYSGSGIARIPFLRNAPAFCSFKDVKVNKDLQLYEGALVLADSVTVIDKKKVDEAVRLGKDIINSLKDKNPNTTVIVAPVSGTVTAVNTTTTSSGDATTMTGGTSTVAVTTSTGQTVTSTPGTNTKVVDESGNVVAISKNGTATQGKYDKNAFGQGATNSEVAQAATDDKLPKVTLTLDTSKPYYGYDTSAGGEPWVSIQTGKSVSLTASVDLRQSSHKATDIRYRTNDGMVVDATGSNPATLTAKGLYSGTAIPILAVADTGKVDSLKTAFVCGKINTVGYDPEYRRVWLVPVNGAKVDKEAIAKKLSAVYRQAVVEWDVQCDPKTMSLTLTDEELKGICKDITVGIASNYTIEQQAVLKKFGREPEERSYILFMVDGKAGDATGFMPLNRSAGFIYLQGQSTDAVARTVAHELGHGAFGLAHEGRAKDNTLAATDNLMDYSGGTALTKAQWDAIHSEYRRLKWFQDAEEGMYLGRFKFVDLEKEKVVYHNSDKDEKGQIVYLTPAGIPFALPYKAKPSFTGRLIDKDGKEIRERIIPNGALLSYELDGNIFKGNFTKKEDGTFVFNGYRISKNSKYDENRAVKQSSYAVFVGEENDNCQLELVVGDYKSTISLYGNGNVPELKKFALSKSTLIEPKRISLGADCINEAWREAPSPTFDEFKEKQYAKINYDGKGSTLIKLKSGTYYCLQFDVEGNPIYHVWNKAMSIWEKTKAPEPTSLAAELRELMSITSIIQLFKYTGHTALDVVGSVPAPIVGELADAINGVWYYVEGDKINAAYSFASAAAVMGMDLGIKAVKYIKYAKGKKVYEVSEEGVDALFELKKQYDNLKVPAAESDKKLVVALELANKLQINKVSVNVNSLRYAEELAEVAKIDPMGNSPKELIKAFGCFTGNTPVLTDKGFTPISSISSGDEVLSYNHESNSKEYKKVNRLKSHLVKGLMLLGLSTGETIEATPNHPFYVKGDYREAATLYVGDTLFSVNKQPITLISTVAKDTIVRVYNFAVDQNACYFVGMPGVLVHNSNLCTIEALSTSHASLGKNIQALPAELKGLIMADLKNAEKGLYDALSTKDGLEAWKMMNQHPILRKDADIITNLGSIIKSKSIDADILAKAIDNAYNGNVPGFGVKTFIETVEKLKDVPNVGVVIKQASSNGSGIRKGAAFVLKKADELGASNIKSFEEKVLISDDKVRIYDILLKKGNRVECKSWSEFYENTIEKQFLKGDLLGAKKLDDIRYFVDEKKMSLDDWFINMRDFMLKHADEIWKEKRILKLFEQAAELKGKKILNTEDFEKFITDDKDVWFDVIFKQKL